MQIFFMQIMIDIIRNVYRNGNRAFTVGEILRQSVQVFCRLLEAKTFLKLKKESIAKPHDIQNVK